AVPADQARAVQLQSHVKQAQPDSIEQYERKYYSGIGSSSTNNNTKEYTSKEYTTKEYTSSRYTPSPSSDRYRYAASPPSVLRSSSDYKAPSVTSSPPQPRSVVSTPTSRSAASPPAPTSSPNSTAYYTREFKLNVSPSVRPESLKAFVTMPNKQTDQAEIIDNHDGEQPVISGSRPLC
ncbi:hypothetical protein ANCCAN_12395, partial [Ancylostoma caninum]